MAKLANYSRSAKVELLLQAAIVARAEVNWRRSERARAFTRQNIAHATSSPDLAMCRDTAQWQDGAFYSAWRAYTSQRNLTLNVARRERAEERRFVLRAMERELQAAIDRESAIIAMWARE